MFTICLNGMLWRQFFVTFSLKIWRKQKTHDLEMRIRDGQEAWQSHWSSLEVMDTSVYYEQLKLALCPQTPYSDIRSTIFAFVCNVEILLRRITRWRVCVWKVFDQMLFCCHAISIRRPFNLCVISSKFCLPTNYS